MNDTPDTSDEAQKPRSGDSIDTRLVRRLADILKATDLTAIEVEQGDLRIRVAREIVVAQAAPIAMAAVGTISGLGPRSYELAVDAAAGLVAA